MRPSGLVHELGKTLPKGAVIEPQDTHYETLRKVWNNMIDRRPAVIVQPHDAKQVVQVVKIAARGDLPLAVRCGGHSFPGFSTCDEGIVLDLSRLNHVSADQSSGLALVGGGALLGDLDMASSQFGMVTPAGLVSHTGAGGLTLGGGMGWTSRRLGLTIDSLVSAEIVTANGDILGVSEASHPDLFWGLRGGGGNFGVVTRFKFRLHRLGPITVGEWHYPPNKIEDALHGLATLASKAPRSQTTTIGLTTSGLSVTAFHSGEDGLGRESVMPFGNLAGLGKGGLKDIDYVSLQRRSDDALPWGRRYYGKGGFLGSLESRAIQNMSVLSRSAPTDDSEIFMIQLGGAVSDVDDDATAYAGRRAKFFWLAQSIWDSALDDKRCLSWGRQAGKSLETVSQAGNYVNEQSDVGQLFAVKAYGQAKYERLARLKAKYDPNNLFRLNQNIVPAVASNSSGFI
jgi:hypothetical protein